MKTKTLKPILASAILFSVLIPAVLAQDTLYLKDGSKLEVRIGDITDTKIEFRKYGSTDLDFYYIDRMDALKIHYDNGDVRNFGEKERVVIKAHKDYKEEKIPANNIIKFKYMGGKFVSTDQNTGISRKISKNEMRRFIDDDLMTLDLYNRFLKNRIWSRTLTYSSVGAIGVGFFAVVGAVLVEEAGIDEEDRYLLAALGFTCAGAGLFIAHIPFRISSKVRGYQTAHSYNKHNASKLSLNFGATKHGLGLVLKF